MSKMEFTEEQMAAMAANPYAHRVTSKQIAFTSEFKEQFWALYCKGVSSWNIMEILGYDPEVFGVVHVSGIQRHIRAEFGKENGFHSVEIACFSECEVFVDRLHVTVKSFEDYRNA